MNRWTTRRAGTVASLAAALLSVDLGVGSLALGAPDVPRATSFSAEAARPNIVPNIVVVMADDMRVDDLRFAPSLRRLVARRGLTFRNSFSTYPLCCPARASFLTGVHPHSHHVWSHAGPWGYRAFDDSRTLATSLRRAGYQTGYVGKYLNGYGPHRSKVSGQRSYRYVPRGWTDWRAAFDNPRVPGIHGSTYHYFDTPFNVNGRVDNRYRGRYQTRVIGDFSVGMARRFSTSSTPFFMYVNYVAPHMGGPPEADDPGWVADRRGERRAFATPARPGWVKGRFDQVVTRAAGLPKSGGPAERNVADKPPFFRRLPELNNRERQALREVTRQRAEAVLVMDRQVRRLVRVLKATGEWKSTVLMFTSDNGAFLGEHRKRMGKVLGHEPSLRVPFLVTGPRMRGRGEHGRHRFDPITTVDVAATIVDLADARPPLRADGVSRLGTMRRGDRGWTTPVLHEALHTGGRRGGAFDDVRTAIGVRTSRYSMLLYRNGHELYDLVRDPAENRNRWHAEAYRPVRRALLRVWWAIKDCRAEECQAALPELLAADAAGTRRHTRKYWRGIDRIYGW
ncbi:MAG: sulfatase family protein [Nocardioides sp.]